MLPTSELREGDLSIGVGARALSPRCLAGRTIYLLACTRPRHTASPTELPDSHTGLGPRPQVGVESAVPSLAGGT